MAFGTDKKGTSEGINAVLTKLGATNLPRDDLDRLCTGQYMIINNRGGKLVANVFISSGYSERVAKGDFSTHPLIEEHGEVILGEPSSVKLNSHLSVDSPFFGGDIYAVPRSRDLSQLGYHL